MEGEWRGGHMIWPTRPTTAASKTPFLHSRSEMKVALIFCVACCLSLSTVAVFDQEWEDWKDLHGKRYSPADEEERHAVWTKNRDFVVQHNKEGHNYTVELNQFADLTSEEFTKLHMSSFNLAKKEEEEGKRWYIPSNLPTLPDEVDWRGKGVVTPIKNQGQCGSCWSFSATGALEGQHALKTGHLISLSEQQLVDCSTTYGNQGCRGGWPYKAFQYIKGVGGIELEKEYPYYAHDERCHANPAEFAANCTGYKDIPSKDENALKVAAATVGPISVAIDASHASFQFYHRGVYDESQCSETNLDHAVLVIGYGTTEGADYWLVKNSWGTAWGMKGYIMMSRNKGNQCGIASQASYPLM